ncbi:Asp23/Gls24 family envelope stress response protein [Microbacterium sp. NPDC055683]
MAEQDTKTTPATPATPGAPRVDRAVAPVAPGEQAGRTTIADHVVAKVAGIAAREVAGVYALGGGGARTLGAIRDAINATDLTQGVKVEVGETQAAADVTIVVEYPTPIQQVAGEVRAAVTRAITQLVGLDVVEVNVAVDDVHLPSADDDESAAESRVS